MLNSRLLGVRIYSYLERQLVSYQVNGVSGAHGLSHLEVRTPQQNALYWGHRLLSVRIYSHLERQLVSYQVNGVSGAYVFSHLEVRNPNRTPCTVAVDS